MGMARVLLLSVIGAALLWSNEPLSADSLYWAEESGDIRTANLNGTNEKVVLTQIYAPTSIAIDGSAGKIYWTNSETGIWRADLNGSHEQALVQTNFQFNPYGLALDIPANKMYWTNGNSGQIIRANLNGSDPQIVLSGLEDPTAIALDVADGKMYWSSQFGGTISDANLDGTDQQVLFQWGRAHGRCVGYRERKLYWLDWGGIIQDANLDGSDRKTVLTGVQGQAGLTLDLGNGKMYWTTWYSQTNPNTGGIWSANLDGTDQEAIISGLSGPAIGIALLSETAPPVPEPPTSALVAIGILGIIGCAVVRRTLTNITNAAGRVDA